jgi:hypothetical protein
VNDRALSPEALEELPHELEITDVAVLDAKRFGPLSPFSSEALLERSRCRPVGFQGDDPVACGQAGRYRAPPDSAESPRDQDNYSRLLCIIE